MQGVTPKRHNNLVIKVIVIKYLYYLFHQLHPPVRYVVKPSDKWTYISGPCLCCEKGLDGREYQRDVCLYILRMQCLCSLQPFHSHGDLYDYVLMATSKLSGLF